MLDILDQHLTAILAGSYIILELAAIVAAVHAVMNVRTAQGATAWFLALISLPFIALPLYAIFGRRRFLGYVAARRAGNAAIEHVTDKLTSAAGAPYRSELDRRQHRYSAFEQLAGTPFLDANEARLLIDGEATFSAIFAALAEATEYVLVQFYILRDDALGAELKQRLLACIDRGVRVYLLFDAIGSYQLPPSYVSALREAGIDAHSFTGSTRRFRRLQINFRNHRKIVVVDGAVAFVGGHNVGDEYLGKDPTLSPWRDTHVELRGPVAAAVQIPFMEDWYWSTGELPIIGWTPVAGRANRAALSLPSGPTDELEAGSLLFVHAIHSARQRLWIVSPYFVPNGSVIDALKLAAVRGVDVRILLPEMNDNQLVQLAGRAYLPELLPCGVRVFRYARGFLHQKVMLIDSDLATVGTANLDNRSMRLNFELTMVMADSEFAAEVETMLIDDFGNADEVDPAQVEAEPWWLRAAARGARLLSPVL